MPSRIRSTVSFVEEIIISHQLLLDAFSTNPLLKTETVSSQLFCSILIVMVNLILKNKAMLVTNATYTVCSRAIALPRISTSAM